MSIEQTRTELQRLLRQVPFQPFFLNLVGGERAYIEHPENVAFDPRPGMAPDFYVLTAGLRMYSTFDKVSSLSTLSKFTDAGGDQVPTP
jgi:hypothetical protein